MRKGLLEDTSDQLWCAAGFTYSQQIAKQIEKKKLVKTFKEMVPPQYHQHAHVFSEFESQHLPEHKPWDHTIEFTPDAPATMHTKVYPMSSNKQEELDHFIKKNVQKGYIRPSKSPLASPVFFVKKKHRKLCFVQDYRRLNEFTIKNYYPLPLVSDIVNRLKGAKYFSKFDVRWGYNNVHIKEGDEWKAAFTTNRGLFKPCVMSFGLTNLPATFQALMNSIFSDLITASKVAVYLDDILIFTKTLEEHCQITNEVLKCLKTHNLFLRLEKCVFKQEEIKYLGLVIKEGEISMDPAKVEAVCNWPTPHNLHAIQGFLGFANFYHCFIKNFSTIARPLHDLTKKNVPWQWSTPHQDAFDTLRHHFISAPVLSLWDPNQPTRIEVDTSGFATGGALLQKLDDGLWHPIAFCSSSMQPAKHNYKIYDQEMLAIIKALKGW
jgi:RNase H-like domain found in reverse transcriptase/Reverse transcriptase (RNA-dependent DNA polymerase)